MESRIGQLLIESGVLTLGQVETILAEQELSGMPFGVLAEDLFSVDPVAVETAWARQYSTMTRTIDPMTEMIDPAALALVSRRQAWQFRVLPIRREQAEYMVATTLLHLRQALRFTTNVLGVPIYMVLAEPEALGRALMQHYPLPGLTAASVVNGVPSMLKLHRPPVDACIRPA